MQFTFYRVLSADLTVEVESEVTLFADRRAALTYGKSEASFGRWVQVQEIQTVDASPKKLMMSIGSNNHDNFEHLIDWVQSRSVIFETQ